MWFLTELIAYLSEHLEVPVSTTVPEKRPTSCVSIVQAGGESSRFVETHNILVHAWGTSDMEALALVYEVADLLFDFPGASVNVAQVNQGGIYTNPYTDGTPRWSGNFSFVTNR